MNTTSPSLLSRLRNKEDHAAWRDFDTRYRDLLIRFSRRRGVSHADAEDLVQIVFADLLRSMQRFIYQPQRGRFRDYLYRCAANAVFDWRRRPNRAGGTVALEGAALDALPDSDGDTAAAALWQEEWENHHFRMAMARIRETFDEKSAAIFERSMSGASVADLARQFEMSTQAVHKVRQRIRDRMEELIAAQVREEDDVAGCGTT
jgi:RNA polymerase sigma-70 factor (ECF subfamily)